MKWRFPAPHPIDESAAIVMAPMGTISGADGVTMQCGNIAKIWLASVPC
jgi:hypothetical protein